MIRNKELTREDIDFAMRSGEFPEKVTASSEVSVVVMTQDWCPQWSALKHWMYGIETDADVDVYELVYNNTSYRDEFMKFKETVFRNSEIPYIRYYCRGKLFNESNYVKKTEFKAILDSAPAK